MDTEIRLRTCPKCGRAPLYRESTEKERRYGPGRDWRLTHECDGMNVLIYARDTKDLEFEWNKILRDEAEAEKRKLEASRAAVAQQTEVNVYDPIPRSIQRRGPGPR